MGVYFTGDSLARKSRRLGSRSRRGSLSEGFLLPQSQPMLVVVREQLVARMEYLRWSAGCQAIVQRIHYRKHASVNTVGCNVSLSVQDS